ncbi:hypothetical protein NC651_003821 [Populus alba x Populus x berolinensis]|nr:hypothetical protein NC651_003821 [Populus alba x Populus x berolinensis]
MSFLCSVCLQSSFRVKQSLGFCFKSDFLYWVNSKWHKKVHDLDPLETSIFYF